MQFSRIESSITYFLCIITAD